EFFPCNEMEKLESEFWNYTMVGANHVGYTDRFYELAKLVPNLVTPESKRIRRDFTDVFPKDLSRLPPQRQVEFRIDLIPGAMPVVKSSYRLAPSKMQDMSEQLQELKDKRFIWPSHSPWEALLLFIKKKDSSLHISCIFEGASRYEDFTTGVAPGIKSIRNSTCRCGGNLDKSFGNTSVKSLQREYHSTLVHLPSCSLAFLCLL
nr:putative reverse transcriptase domain-containing protein [Tanacetum cinerariifolium]